MKLSSRLARVGASPTLAISAKAKALRREGRDIVAFGAGEPDFDTPEPIKEAARLALAQGKTKYSPPAGEVELREALAKQYADRWSLQYEVEEILVSCGAKHSLYNLFTALLDEGDEVIVPSPYWVSYPAQVLLAGGNPVTVEAGPEDNFFPSIEALDRAVTPKTRAIVVNSPSNPTGAVMTKGQLDELTQWLLAHPDVIAVYDGIYENLVYEGAEYYELAALHPDLREQVVCINGVAKSFAMTGWRIGWALGPKALIKAMGKLQSQSTSGPTTMAQWATIAALELDPEVVQAMVRTYDKRRILTSEMLEALPHVSLHRPKGAFYAFPDFSAYVGGKTKAGASLDDDLAIAGYLLDEAGVAMVPGSAFGAPGFMRITYACSEAQIEKGINRIGEALAHVSVPG